MARRSIRRYLILLLASLSGVGCAGPSTPFGAMNGLARMSSQIKSKLATRFNSSSPNVRFSPNRQSLHDQSDFDVYINDLQGVPKDYKLTLTYNGVDMTTAFLKNADITFIDMGHRHLKISTKHLRLPLSREHNIEIVYKRNPTADPVIAEFLPPHCTTFATDRQVASIPKFAPTTEMIKAINSQSTSHKFNPYLVAGLIAKESSFDSTAISSSKAIGLTQVTSLGEAEVVKFNPKWPRYPGIDSMSLLQLKYKVYKGKIHEENEWRLNPTLSIQGGVAYLSHISEYWRKADKQELLAKNLANPSAETSAIYLASYNSGPARVSRAIERGGDSWLNDDELDEARKYVRKVISYCDHFEQEQKERYAH